MFKIIRYIARKDADLYVLEEQDSKKWVIRSYPEGFAEITRRMQDYFQQEVKFPCNTRGLEELTLKYFLDQRVKVEETSPLARSQFYDSFIQDFYLKAHPNLPWFEYVKLGQPDLAEGGYRRVGQKELTERLISMISALPELIGIRSPCLTYLEVPLANQFAPAFADLRESLAFLEKKQAPSLFLKTGITRPDFVMIRDKYTYVVELKFTRWDTKEQRETMQKQLLLAGHFLHRNWDINFTLVGVEYRNNKGNEILRYRHFDFNPESKQLVLTKDSGW